MTVAPPHLESVITLSLLEASDSFAAVWDELATEYGVELKRTADLERWLALPATIRVATAGGAEAEFAAALATQAPLVDVAVIGADPSHRLAVTMIKAGAAQYFAFPDDVGVFRSWLQERIDGHLRLGAQRSFAAREEARYRFDGLLGTSPALKQALGVAARVIPRGNVTVLIGGETGTGKELLARAIHYNGPRRAAPFVDVNCAAIPEQLLESELFGHEKGAFTDAATAKPGLFEVANGGTIFLDEIGHLPLPLQGKLLRSLEQRSIRRVGSTMTIPVDVRIIAATHVHLAEAVRRGEFREDLYYRLNVLQIELPPLRVRGDDVILLAQHFLTKFAADHGVTCPTIGRVAETRLRDHSWPGNVRELRNVMERAVVLNHGGELDPLALDFRPERRVLATTEVPFPATMSEIIRCAVRAMVDRCQGNKSEAARRLAISRTRLLRLLDPATPDDDLEAGS